MAARPLETSRERFPIQSPWLIGTFVGGVVELP